MNPIQILFS